jgi:hypothetical protein
MSTKRDSNRCGIVCTNGRQENGELECYDLIFVQEKSGINMNFNIRVTTVGVQMTVYGKSRQLEKFR